MVVDFLEKDYRDTLTFSVENSKGVKETKQAQLDEKDKVWL